MEPREPSSFSMREFQRAALPSHVDAIRASLQKLAQAERVILLQERQRSLDSKVLEHYAKHYGVYGGERVEFQVQPPYTVDSPEAMNEYVEKLRQALPPYKSEVAESIWWKDLDADPNVPKMPVTIEDVLLFGVAVIEPENPERQAIVNEGQFTYGFIRYSEIYTDDAGQRMGREIHIRVIPE